MGKISSYPAASARTDSMTFIVVDGGINYKVTSLVYLDGIATEAYVDAAVVGLYDDRGNYDASSNTFPSAGGSGTAGAILKGDVWRISVAGTLGTTAVRVGDTVRALVDTPGSTAGNWAILQAEVGYVALDRALNLSDLANVTTARTNLGFTAPILDKASPGAIGGTSPNTLAATTVTLTGELTQSIAGGGSSRITVKGEGTTGLTLDRYSADANGPSLLFEKGRGTIASPAVVVLNDGIGNAAFRGYTGSAFVSGVQVQASVIAATPSGTDMQSQLLINICGAGSVSASACVRMDSTGFYFFGSGTPSIDANRIIRPRSYTVGTAPTVTATGFIHFSDDAVFTAVPAYAEGSNWRRFTDGKLVNSAAATIDGISFSGLSDITVIAPAIHAASAKTALVGADQFGIADSAASFALKSTTLDSVRLALRTPSIQAVTSSATVTPTFSDDLVTITAQAAGLTLANPTGTAISGLGIVIRIKDNGTARAISYGTQYRAIGVTLPTTTVIGKTTYIGMIYNSADTKWDVVATGTEV